MKHKLIMHVSRGDAGQGKVQLCVVIVGQLGKHDCCVDTSRRAERQAEPNVVFNSRDLEVHNSRHNKMMDSHQQPTPG